ncbi:MAG: hypothetical protein ABIH11_02050 [Candidatus Altiarchaeota archaeon]
MQSNLEQIQTALQRLYEDVGEIQACMVTKRGLEGIVIFPEDFKEQVSEIWEPLSECINDELEVIAKYTDYAIDKTYVELLGYGVGFQTLTYSDTALAVFISNKEGCDPLEVLHKNRDKIMETRDKILKIES